MTRDLKPFRVNDCWFENKYFISFVNKEWKSLKVEGRSDYVIKEKHKQLKGSLGRWNTEVFGRLNLEVQEGKDDINEVGKFLSCCKEDQVYELVIIRSSVIILMWKSLVIK